MRRTVHGPAVIEFWWKVSSEHGCDFLRFRVDDQDIYAISGSVNWQRRIYYVPEGAHTIEFRYTKDGSISRGADCGWVDDVSWGSPCYTPSGELVSVPIPGPGKRIALFCNVTWSVEEPDGTDVKFYLEFQDQRGYWVLIPDDDLQGNTGGFDQPPDISGLSGEIYGLVRLRARLTTQNSQGTPAVLMWEMWYRYRLHVEPEPSVEVGAEEQGHWQFEAAAGPAIALHALFIAPEARRCRELG